jgi:transposase
MKANRARLGIRGFRPHLAQAARELETLQTRDGAAVPANTSAELRRDMSRLRFVKQQIKEIERARADSNCTASIQNSVMPWSTC